MLWVGMLFLCLQAGQGMGDNAVSALFFLRFGVDFLPFMYLLLGGSTFVLTLAYSAGLGRFERRRFFQALILTLIVLLVMERLALIRPFHILYPILWLTVSGMGMILGTFTWNLAGEVSDTRQAKRLFPLFASSGILGSVLGNFVTGLIAKHLGTDNLLIFSAGLLGAGYFLTRVITRKYLRPAKSDRKAESLIADLRSGYDFVRSSPLMMLVALASVLFSILFFAVAFPFNKVITSSFPDEASVAGFLGLFSGITTAVTFLVSLFVANRIYARLGIVNSILLMPLTYVFGFLVFSTQYSLAGGVIARFSQLVILSGVAGTAWNALFNVVPSQKRGQVLAFENGVPSQIGVALSGVLLILGQRVLTTSQILLMGMLFTVVCGLLVWRMRGAYGEALIAALRAGRLEVFHSEEAGFTRLKTDAAAMDVLIGALQDVKPATRRLAAEILGRMRNASAIAALAAHTTDPQASVRAAAVHALGELGAASAVNAIVVGLDDVDSEVRLQALVALAGLGVDPSPEQLEKVKQLLNDDRDSVRVQAVIILARLGQATTVLPHLMKWMGASNPASRIAALQAVGSVTAYLGDSFDSSLVLQALRNPLPAIRVAACVALASVKDQSSAHALADSLHDSQPAVRKAAAESLRGRGLEAQDPILNVLHSDDASASDAALDALLPGDERIAKQLRSLARTEIIRMGTLRGQVASLPSGAGAVALLSEELRHQLRRGEERLLKILGLIGNPRAMEDVRKAIQSTDPQARAAALEALETLGDKTLARGVVALLEREPESSAPIPVLADILEAGSRWSRTLAVRTVQELGLKELLPSLIGLRSDPQELVREAAIQALVRFGEVKPMNTLQTVSTLDRVLLLREVPIFSDLAPEDLEQVAEIADEQWFPGGAEICHEGEEGNMMYIIVDGSVRVGRSASGTDQLLAERGRGDFVGEMAIIEAAPRSATLLTQGDVRVLAIDGETFKGILRERPEVSLAVMRSLSRRLREMPG